MRLTRPSLVLPLVVAACAEFVAPNVADEPLRVEVTATELRITNVGAQSVAYIATERGFAARALFCFCETAPQVAPGATVAISRDELLKHVTPAEYSGEAIVFWWYPEDTSGERGQPTIRNIVVALE